MTGCKWTLEQCRDLPLPAMIRLFAYWRKNPPEHELMAIFARVFTTWEPPRTIEEQWAEGAMNIADMAHHYQQTGGKIVGIGKR